MQTQEQKHDFEKANLRNAQCCATCIYYEYFTLNSNPMAFGNSHTVEQTICTKFAYRNIYNIKVCDSWKGDTK